MYPSIDPIFLHLGPLTIHWYGLTMTLAIFLAAFVASRYVARHGQNPNAIWDMLLWVLIPAIIGARLYFVFIQSPRGPNGLDGYLAHPIEILQIWNGGIHIYGAFIFGGIALFLYLRFAKLPPLIFLDGVGLGLLLGQAIGRIGNFINQELYGPPTTLPWGLRIDPDHRIAPFNDLTTYPESTRFHPLFLYELLWDGIGFALLFWLSRRFQGRLRDGDLFLLYLIWAPLGRFFLEFLRTDSWFFPGTPFNTAHILTAFAVLAASITLFLRYRHKPALQTQELTTSTVTPADRPAEETTVAPETITESTQEETTVAPETIEETTVAPETFNAEEKNTANSQAHSLGLEG